MIENSLQMLCIPRHMTYKYKGKIAASGDMRIKSRDYEICDSLGAKIIPFLLWTFCVYCNIWSIARSSYDVYPHALIS